MIPDEKTSSVSRQEFIDLLCRITKTNEEMTTTINDDDNNNNIIEPDITIIEDKLAVEEGEIITLDEDDDDDAITNRKEVEDGEITESQGSDNDDVDELNLRLNALRSLAGAKQQRRQKTKKFKFKRKRSSDNNRYINDDIDLRSPNKNRSFARQRNQTSNHDDREYLLDKDYRRPGVFDMLLSLISPDNNNSTTNISNRKLLDNYDIQQMDIVDDQPISLPPPLPPNHLPFFDPLPPLPPPPPSLFDMFTVHQPFPSTNWPRPNFVQPSSIPPLQTEVWPQSFNNSTDIDLRLQPINHHHHHITPQINEQLPQRKSQQQRRKRSKKFSKKHYHERESNSPVIISSTTNHTEQSPLSINNNNNNDDDEEERLLREQLLRTLSSKRKVTIVEPINSEPERIVTIISSTSPPPIVNPTPVIVNKPVEITTKSQYSINQRYKRVKANVSLTNVTNKTETTTTTTVVRTAQPVFQTRNKIVRAPETDGIDMPQSNPIIITFDDQTTDDEEQQQQTVKKPNESTYLIADEERQAIKRLQQLQEEVIRRSNAIELTTKAVAQKVQTSPPAETVQEAIPSTDELSALFEKRRMLLTERSKYGEIQEKMKKKN